MGLSRSDVRRRLGEDLWALVRELGGNVPTVTALTTLWSPHHRRAAFRLDLPDGRTLKGRRFDSVAQAERVECLSRVLDQRSFPRVLARRGAALVTEWADGTPVGRAGDGDPVFRHAGALQATMHRQRLSDEILRTVPPRRASREIGLERKLHELVSRGALCARKARQAWTTALAHGPATSAVGLVHGDFCAENMVRGADGRLRVVDNEALSIDACDYDLARTWYRWPMTPSQRSAYYEGYAARRGLDAFVAAFPYWAVVALVDAAVFRVRGRTRDARLPLARLGALLRGDCQPAGP